MRRWYPILLLCWFGGVAAQTQPANAAIASAHPLATAAGQTILKQGGNAFDAAVAVAATLAVVEPYSSGLGGGGFFLLHRARDGKEVMIDARERAPSDAGPDMFRDAQGQPRSSLNGPRAAAIPGLPAGLAHLAQQYGRLSLRQSLAPAIRLAKRGFPVDERYRAIARLRLEALRGQAEAMRQYLVRDDVPPRDAVLVQARLARTLGRLAERGADGFYRGPVARELVRAVRAGGGIWQGGDLRGYEVRERAPVAFDYRGLHIVSAAPPSAGGLTLGEALHILQGFDIAKLAPAQRMHLVAEALRRAYHDRARYMGDPDFVRIPEQRLLDPAYAARRGAAIDLANATPSSDLETAPDPSQGDHTTHFSIVDRRGNRVAATLSINTFFGSGFVAGKTGVLLNNEMDDFSIAGQAGNFFGLAPGAPNRIVPGKRPLSSMTPTFVEDARGTLILGAPGGSRIISMVLLAILEYEAQPKVDLAALVAAPRYHHQYLPDRLEVEPDAFPAEVLDELRLAGHVVQVVNRRWGNMQAVWVERKTGKAVAASDPRGSGAGIAWF